MEHECLIVVSLKSHHMPTVRAATLENYINSVKNVSMLAKGENGKNLLHYSIMFFLVKKIVFCLNGSLYI